MTANECSQMRMPNPNGQLKLPNIIKTMLHQLTITNNVLVNEEPGILTKRLATELGEVKKAVDNNFVRMFRKRNTLLETMTPLWQQIYEFTRKCTNEPIHLVNNFIEDARENKKKLWVLTQDMKKVFDSVGLDVLKPCFALYRHSSVVAL
uniref:Uncharacterized protein n=1 Tax=Rhizophagus irregularis (strain DAOM 181602 / DAOM 197198 / MUCL 43194) TaxID=747089 RepID=U9SW26_RHIID